MAEDNCRHEWSIINLRSGYLVTEGCAHCGGRTSFFALEDRHHMDSYVDGDHIWKFLGSSQAVKFDLKCNKCGKEVILEKTQALAMCVNCRDDCKAAAKGEGQGDENTWVYLALCVLSTHEYGECVPGEETRALTEYFNSKIKTPGKKIIFVPCILRDNIDFCQAEIIADVGMKDID